MKKKSIITLFVMGLMFCLSASITQRTPHYTPVLMKRSDLANSVRYVAEGRALVHPGKIYYKEPYLFINEKYKGIHVIDNTLPASPKKVGFIVAPGCIDMAVKDHFLYLDNSVDLVTIDLETKQVTHRIESVLPEPAHPDNMWYQIHDRPAGMVVVEWQLTNN